MSAHTPGPRTVVTRFVAHERPNALCAVCLRRGKMVRASHDVARGPHAHMACDGHAERAERWGRVEDGSFAREVAALGGAR